MDKKTAILTSALKLLTEKGVHNTPMSAIAKAAGTGMGTIYNYFPNKEVLINEIYVNIKRKEASIFLDFKPNQPIKTQFEVYITSIVKFFIANPAYFQFMEQLQASPIITEKSRAEGVKAINATFQLLVKGQQERIIKAIATEELLQFIGGAVLSYLRWYFGKKEKSDKSLEHQTEMLWDAIKA